MITTPPPASEFELGPTYYFSSPCDSNYLQIWQCSCEVQGVMCKNVEMGEGEVPILNMKLVQLD